MVVINCQDGRYFGHGELPKLKLALILIGLFTGVLARTALPFIRKMKQGKIKEFKITYFYQGLSAVLLALIAVVLLFPQFDVDPSRITDIATGFQVFATSFTFGFTSNTLLNELLEWRQGGEEISS